MGHRSPALLVSLVFRASQARSADWAAASCLPFPEARVLLCLCCSSCKPPAVFQALSFFPAWHCASHGATPTARAEYGSTQEKQVYFLCKIYSGAHLHQLKQGLAAFARGELRGEAAGQGLQHRGAAQKLLRMHEPPCGCRLAAGSGEAHYDGVRCLLHNARLAFCSLSRSLQGQTNQL